MMKTIPGLVYPTNHLLFAIKTRFISTLLFFQFIFIPLPIPKLPTKDQPSPLI